MKKKTPYLDFYKKCVLLGEMPVKDKRCRGGLCEFFRLDILFIEIYLRDHWDEDLTYAHAYWAAGLPWERNKRKCIYGFTPLRQNMVLLLAALNEEL